MRVRPLCHGTKNPAFLTPNTAPKQALAAATKMCAACPVIRKCAIDALTSGTLLREPNHSNPAIDVFQAGLICDGSPTVTQELARRAGVDPPPPPKPRFRAKIPPECRNCGRPMAKWTRGKVPFGFVMHYARGYCTGCRSAYTEFMRNQQPAPDTLRKVVDRHRHHACTTWTPKQ